MLVDICFFFDNDDNCSKSSARVTHISHRTVPIDKRELNHTLTVHWFSKCLRLVGLSLVRRPYITHSGAYTCLCMYPYLVPCQMVWQWFWLLSYIYFKK